MVLLYFFIYKPHNADIVSFKPYSPDPKTLTLSESGTPIASTGASAGIKALGNRT